jgi:hypothetical protein
MLFNKLPCEHGRPIDGSWRVFSGLILIIAAAVHLAALLNAKPLQSANDRSRWCTVWSLCERGTFQIDEIRRQPGWDSIDIVHVDGHFYSTKPPLLTVLVAGLTWCVTRVTGWSLLEETHAVTTVVLLIVNILPFILSLWLLAMILERHARTEWCKVFVLLTSAFATLLTPFLMTFNNHAVAAAGAMLALFMALRFLSDAEPRGWTLALCGLASAWTCTNELPAAALGLATLTFAWKRSNRKTLVYYLPAAVVPLLAFFVTNVVATGSWKPIYADFGSAKYQFVIDGIPSYWTNPQGIDRNLDSPWIYFVHCTVGHHGILSLSPVFVLTLAGWISARRCENVAFGSILRCGATLTSLVLAFYLTRTQNYNYGGVSCALRWSLWLIPFWLCALIPVVDWTSKSRLARAAAATLLMVSSVFAWLPVANPWQQPWLFHQMERFGWIDYREKPSPLPNRLWTWFASLPELTDTPREIVWAEYVSSASRGGVSRMRVTCRKKTTPPDDELLILDLLQTDAWGVPAEPRVLHIDPVAFRNGSPPAEFVRWPSGTVTPEQQQADLMFVRGLPLRQEFRPGVIRYLKTPLRADAFRCQRAAAQVTSTAIAGDPLLRYRCDLWLCPDVPFGVVQFEFQVSPADAATPIRQERWTLSACDPMP